MKGKGENLWWFWFIVSFFASLIGVGYGLGWRGWVGVLVGLNFCLCVSVLSDYESKKKAKVAAEMQAARDNDEYRLFE